MLARPIASAALWLSLAAVAPAAAEEVHDLEALVIEMATTPAQHKAVAAHDREKAAEARKEAERHRSMLKAYGGTKSVTRQEFEKHCNRLISGSEKQAEEYEELAKLHDQAASTTP
jgi:hypothetical protein